MSDKASRNFAWLVSALAIAITLLALGATFASGEGADEQWRKNTDEKLKRATGEISDNEAKLDEIDHGLMDLKGQVRLVSRDIEWIVEDLGGTPERSK